MSDNEFTGGSNIDFVEWMNAQSNDLRERISRAIDEIDGITNPLDIGAVPVAPEQGIYAIENDPEFKMRIHWMKGEPTIVLEVTLKQSLL